MFFLSLNKISEVLRYNKQKDNKQPGALSTMLSIVFKCNLFKYK